MNKNINFDKNETELKMENSPTRFQRDKPCASAHIRIAIKRKTVMS